MTQPVGFVVLLTWDPCDCVVDMILRELALLPEWLEMWAVHAPHAIDLLHDEARISEQVDLVELPRIGPAERVEHRVVLAAVVGLPFPFSHEPIRFVEQFAVLVGDESPCAYPVRVDRFAGSVAVNRNHTLAFP